MHSRNPPSKPTVIDRGTRPPRTVRPRDRRQRGAVMMETVLTLPTILLILSLTVYFGLSVERLARTTMLDRFETWRQAHRAVGPTAANGSIQLETGFFADDEGNVRIDEANHIPPGTEEEFLEIASQFDEPTIELAQAYMELLPTGRWLRATTSHDVEVPLWERLHGPIQHQHVVLAGEWRFPSGVGHPDPNVWGSYYTAPFITSTEAIRETFFLDFDDQIQPFSDRGNRFAESMQRWYYAHPPYRGYDVMRSDWGTFGGDDTGG